MEKTLGEMRPRIAIGIPGAHAWAERDGYIGYLERRNVRLVFTAINVDTFIDIKFLARTYGQYYCGDA